ncbi:hypothetical protein HID58_026869, partial [Brassica napus]
FVKESSILLVTVLDSDPSNHPYIDKFFVSLATRVASLKAEYREVATSYKGQGLFFLAGDAESGQHALHITISFCISQSFSSVVSLHIPKQSFSFCYFGLGETQVPLIIILTPDNKKYLETNVMVDQIESWMKDFKVSWKRVTTCFLQERKVAARKKSQPIPAENNKPVKVVVAESLDDIVFKSGKNVLSYAPSCGHCQKLAPILDEVALKLQNDPSVIIAKLDATENDIPSEPFDRSASGNVNVEYEGDRTKEDFISFIEKNKATNSHGDETTSTKIEEAKRTGESAAKDDCNFGPKSYYNDVRDDPDI